MSPKIIDKIIKIHPEIWRYINNIGKIIDHMKNEDIRIIVPIISKTNAVFDNFVIIVQMLLLYLNIILFSDQIIQKDIEMQNLRLHKIAEEIDY